MKIIVNGEVVANIGESKIPKSLSRLLASYKEAQENYRTAIARGLKLQIQEKTVLVEQKKQVLKNELDKWIATADQQSQRGALVEAQFSLAVILHISQECFSTEPQDRSYYFNALNNLAVILKKQFHLKKALTCFQAAQAVVETVPINEVNEHSRITLQLNTCNLFSRTGRYPKVLECCDRIISHTKGVVEKEVENLLRNAKHNKAIALLNMGNLDGGLQLITELETYHSRHPANSLKIKIDVIRIMHDKGVVWHCKGLWEQALAQYEMALAQYQALQKNGEDVDGEIADEMSAIAVIYQQQKEFAKASEYWTQALKIYESKLKPGEDCYQIKDLMADVYNNLGLHYQDQSQLNEAIAKYHQALVIYQEIYTEPEDQFKIADTKHNLGLALFKQGNYTSAIAEQDAAVRIYSKVYGDEHFKVAGERHELARSYRRLAMTSSQSASEQNLVKAAVLLSENLKKHHELLDKAAPPFDQPFSVFELATYHNMLHELGMVHVMQGNPREAALLFEDEMKRFLPPTTKARDWPIAALRYSKKALYYFRMLNPLPRQKIAEIYVARAKIYRDQAQLYRAIICLEKAITLNVPNITDEAIGLKKDLEILKTKKSQEMGEDLYQQIQEIRNQHEELQQLYLDELPKLTIERSLSEHAKNMTTALIIQLDGLLDQSYDRFVQQAIYRPNHTEGGDLYFPIESSMQDLQTALETQLVVGNQRRIGAKSLDLGVLSKIPDFLFEALQKAGYLGADSHTTDKWLHEQDLRDLDEKCDPYRTELCGLLVGLDKTHSGQEFKKEYLLKGVSGVKGVQLISKAQPIPEKTPPSHEEILQALVKKGYALKKGGRYFLADTFTLASLEQPLQLGATPEEAQRFLNYERQIKTKLKKILNSQSLEVTYRDGCYRSIIAKQPFLGSVTHSVIPIIRAISNDSKHVRLTPQGFSENLAERTGLFRVGSAKIELHYASNPSAKYPDASIQVSELLQHGIKELEEMMTQFERASRQAQQAAAAVQLPALAAAAAPPPALAAAAASTSTAATVSSSPTTFLTPTITLPTDHSDASEFLHATMAKWPPIQAMKLHELQQYHASIKGVAKSYHVANKLELAGDLYSAAAKHVQDKYPWLASVYYDKAIREYRHCGVNLSSTTPSVTKLQASCQQRRKLLHANEFRWQAITPLLESDELCDEHAAWFQELKKESELPTNPSSIIDPDVYSQWEYAREQYWQLLYGSLRLSMYSTQKPYLFDRLQNQAIDITIKLRHALDQGFARFVEQVIDKANGKTRAHKDSESTVHYLCAGSEKRLEQLCLKTEIASPDTSKTSLTESKYHAIYEAIQESQPYYYHAPKRPIGFWRESWLEKITYLSNKAKHVGWVPVSNGFEERLRQASEVDQVFQVHCTEERAYDWIFREQLGDDAAKSAQLMKLLRAQSYLDPDNGTVIDHELIALANSSPTPNDPRIQAQVVRLKKLAESKNGAFKNIADAAWSSIVKTLLMLTNPLLTLDNQIGWQPCAPLISRSLEGTSRLLTSFFSELGAQRTIIPTTPSRLHSK